MKRFLAILLLLTSCVTTPREKCYQVNYIENGEVKHIFLNVIDYGNYWEVVSQEYLEEEPSFVITEVIEY